MIRRPAVLALAVACMVITLAPAADAARGWKQLGSRKVTDRVDHDSISVTASRGNFTALQVRVKGVAVEFRSMTVHFRNGDRQEVALRRVIPAGGSSRVIDLEGGDRVIRRVDFVYDSQSLRGRSATIRLFGRR
jgi:hypothetical protein